MLSEIKNINGKINSIIESDTELAALVKQIKSLKQDLHCALEKILKLVHQRINKNKSLRKN